MKKRVEETSIAAPLHGGRAWLHKLGLALGSSLLTLLVVEALLWLAGIAPDRWAHPWHMESADKRFGLDLYPDNPRGYFDLDLRDEETRQRWEQRGVNGLAARASHTPFAVGFEYDAALCRAPPLAAPDPARQRVVVIGDSFSEGQGVRAGDTFAALLDRELGDAVEVINCGRRGYDFPELHGWFERHLALEPEVVVYAMILNDPQQSEVFAARQKFLDDWILIRRQMYTTEDGSARSWRPRLYSLLADRLEAKRVGAESTQWYRGMVSEPNAEGWLATQDQIAAMDQRMRQRGGRLIVILWPLFVGLDGEYPFEQSHRIIAEALAARGIRFHDALGAFRGREPETLWAHPSDRHPNEVAHRIFAAELAPLVREAL